LELKLKLKNQRISEQKQELSAQNDKLVIAQKELSDLNKRILEDQEALMKQNKNLLYYQLKVKRANEDLEARVKNRTQELEERNTRLKEYAFINAHLLRAPLCRIKGLTYLVEKEQDGNDKQLMALLKASNEELEEIIHKITTILSEEKALNRDLLYELYSRDEIMKSNIKHGEAR
jgi:signal transduction histidine kinase